MTINLLKFARSLFCYSHPRDVVRLETLLGYLACQVCLGFGWSLMCPVMQVGCLVQRRVVVVC